MGCWSLLPFFLSSNCRLSPRCWNAESLPHRKDTGLATGLGCSSSKSAPAASPSGAALAASPSSERRGDICILVYRCQVRENATCHVAALAMLCLFCLDCRDSSIRQRNVFLRMFMFLLLRLLLYYVCFHCCYCFCLVCFLGRLSEYDFLINSKTSSWAMHCWLNAYSSSWYLGLWP